MTENTENTEVDVTDETDSSDQTGSAWVALGITLGIAFATGAVAAIGNRVVHRVDRWIDKRELNKRAKDAIIIVEETDNEEV